ncbi:putative SANT/Myb domain-containing protein [Dioscorea sansibarensis]
MVLKHNKRPFGAEESCQPTCKHNIRRLNCGGRLASFGGISSFTDDGGKEAVCQLQGQSRVEGYRHVTCPVANDEKQTTIGFAVVPKDHSSSGCYSTSGLFGGDNCDVVRPEYGRQLLCEDNSFQLGCAEFNQDFQLHLFSEILPVSSIHERSLISVAGCEEMPADDTNLCGPPRLSWHTFNSHEEAIHLEPPGGACFFPCFEDDHQMVEYKLLEEINSSVPSYPYQKPVATGPKHQADIPVWRPDEFKNYVGNSDDSEDMPANDNPSSTLSFSWHTCNTFEEGSRLESAVGASFIPYFEDDHQIVGRNHVEETFSSALDYHERKPVAIGPHHQADIPMCGLTEFENSVGHSDDSVSSASNSVDMSSSSAHLVTEEDSSDKWIGMCILPMPDYGMLSLEVKGRSCRNLCNCLDMGSIRCVRQHVVESREKLEQALGHEKFMMLGFGDMGEVVARKWSTEEEQAFQEVVMANPASLGKNFWDDLRHVLISRSSKELISYYFNVFMLRKRAEQNRMDPMNADSDNDEWEESSESVAGDDEDDSVVESPHDGDDVTYNDGDATDVHEVTEDLYTCDGDDDGSCDVPENHNSNKLQPMSDAYLSDKNFDKGMEEQDVQDDLCTSYDGEQSGADT